jgi:hypothetical protein
MMSYRLFSYVSTSFQHFGDRFSVHHQRVLCLVAVFFILFALVAQ